MRQQEAVLQICLVLLLALTAAIASTPIARETMAHLRPSPLADVMNEVADSMATRASVTTD